VNRSRRSASVTSARVRKPSRVRSRQLSVRFAGENDKTTRRPTLRPTFCGLLPSSKTVVDGVSAPCNCALSLMSGSSPQKLVGALVYGLFYRSRQAKRRRVGVNEPSTVPYTSAWSHLRFAVIGSLLAGSPEKGALHGALRRACSTHLAPPVTGRPVRFGLSTIERWLYARAKRAAIRSVFYAVRCARTWHPRPRETPPCSSFYGSSTQPTRTGRSNCTIWNLKAFGRGTPELGGVPCYSSIRRFFKAQGLHRRRRLSSRRTEGAERAEERLSRREVRSYECRYSNLSGTGWHQGSLQSHARRRIRYPRPHRHPRRSLAPRCHLQWYLGVERAQIMAISVAAS